MNDILEGIYDVIAYLVIGLRFEDLVQSWKLAEPREAKTNGNTFIHSFMWGTHEQSQNLQKEWGPLNCNTSLILFFWVEKSFGLILIRLTIDD